MSYLLFLDESGHDHQALPYEIHGGIALHVNKLWPFIQALKALEQSCFGDALHVYGSEIKGMKLLSTKRFRLAEQDDWMDGRSRRKYALRFLNDNAQKRKPRRDSFTAFGQASLKLSRGIFDLLTGHDARIFAVAIPRGVQKPQNYAAEDFLRKDLVFLLERFFQFLADKNESGLVVMDETDMSLDRRLLKQLEAYFRKTQTGRARASRIVPSPFFVSSEMTYPVQVANVCTYCINWGFRLPGRGMDAEVRKEIADEFAGVLGTLQHRSTIEIEEGQEVSTFSIVYVSDPYTSRGEN